MSKYWYECFIAPSHKFCLIDGSGDIRATAYDMEGISIAKAQYGWGKIHKMNVENNKITYSKREVKK